MQFSDTTNRTGIIELIEDLTGTQGATTSSYSLKTKTRDVNNAYSRYFMVAVRAEGRWQVDDTNQTDYPTIVTNLVSGQQDYSFTVDGSATPNQILDIYMIEIKDSVGNWTRIYPYDRLNKMESPSFDATVTGLQSRYDKTANGIFLDMIPNYNSTGGLKVYFNRTPVYFVSTDTTKKPGIPDMFHEYLALRPSYQYCLRKGLPQKNDLKADVFAMENDIELYYSNRSKDETKQMTSAYRSSR